MFWGLAIEPGKRYMQTVAKSFHLSMACLELNTHDNDAVPIMLDYDGQEYVLCNLHRHKIMQCQLDLNFKAGEKIAFYSAGKSRVHLSGYILEELEDLEISDEDEDEEEEENEEEVPQSKSSPVKKRKEQSSIEQSNKKQKLSLPADDSEDDEDDADFLGENEEIEEDDDDDFDDDEDDDEDEDEEDEESDEQPTPAKTAFNKSLQKKSPGDKQKKKENVQTPKTPVREQNGQVKTPQTQSSKKNKNKLPGNTPKSDASPGGTPQRKVGGGVIIQDVIVGSGGVAKPGRKIAVYYTGRLKDNNKQFDATTSGPGFRFTLGRNEVIKGWEMGLSGMKVGGKRTITIPPPLAYGKQGQPPVIPPNSTLVFDVELKSVN